MDEVERQGGQIELYPLICQSEAIIHEEVEKWLSRRNCFPFLSKQIIKSNISRFFSNPIRYLKIFFKIFFGNISSFDFLIKAVTAFPKSVHIAGKMQKEEISHIHCHYATHPALMAYIIHNFTGIPYSITIHSHDIYDCHAMLKQKLASASFIVTISQYNVEYLKELLGKWIEKKIYVIPCGIDISKYISPTEKTNPKFSILQIGSLHWKKGQEYFIEAVKILKDKNIDFEAKIIGDGPQRDIVEKSIHENEVEDYILLLGAKSQQEVQSILPTANIYVQSSVSEGIPVAIMEALSCELPVIATNITGIPEIIIPGKTGILVSPKNPVSIADAIQFFINHPEIANLYGKQGRILVEDKFNLENNTKELVSLFQKFDKQGKI